jgi:carbonic anhydrase/acetyltransferase-like protein (isoleucine patch superfamily)
LIYGLPTAAIVALLTDLPSVRAPVAIMAPLLWTLVFLGIAGLLSVPHRFAVTAGKFLRDLNDPLYFHRRLHGLCWTTVFYNKPAYFTCLSIPAFKWMTFRMFGYRGSMNFTVYPDTWIRDLPLLHFDDGVYVSNRATLGTNIVLRNGYLLVRSIRLRSKALVGHLAMLAPGVELGVGAEVAVGGGIGIGTKLGSGSFVGPCCVIEHGVRLGANASVGAQSYVGSGSALADDSCLPAGSFLAPRTRVTNAPGERTELSA